MPALSNTHLRHGLQAIEANTPADFEACLRSANNLTADEAQASASTFRRLFVAATSIRSVLFLYAVQEFLRKQPSSLQLLLCPDQVVHDALLQAAKTANFLMAQRLYEMRQPPLPVLETACAKFAGIDFESAIDFAKLTNLTLSPIVLRQLPNAVETAALEQCVAYFEAQNEKSAALVNCLIGCFRADNAELLQHLLESYQYTIQMFEIPDIKDILEMNRPKLLQMFCESLRVSETQLWKYADRSASLHELGMKVAPKTTDEEIEAKKQEQEVDAKNLLLRALQNAPVDSSANLLQFETEAIRASQHTEYRLSHLRKEIQAQELGEDRTALLNQLLEASEDPVTLQVTLKYLQLQQMLADVFAETLAAAQQKFRENVKADLEQLIKHATESAAQPTSRKKTPDGEYTIMSTHPGSTDGKEYVANRDGVRIGPYFSKISCIFRGAIFGTIDEKYAIYDLTKAPVGATITTPAAYAAGLERLIKSTTDLQPEEGIALNDALNDVRAKFVFEAVGGRTVAKRRQTI